MKQSINRFSWSALRRVSVVAAAVVTALGGLVEGARAQGDDFADPITLAGHLGTTNIDTTGFTAEEGEPNHAGQTASASAWFHWTAPEDGLVQFDTVGSDFDTVLAVYTGGSDITGLDFLVGNDDIVTSYQNSSPRYPSLVKFNAKAGQTYLIAVDGYGGAGIGGIASLSWAYYSAGAFWFTADSYICSERDGETSGTGTTGWSVLGARVTITRVAGAAGRVNLDVVTVTNAAVIEDGLLTDDRIAISGVDFTPINQTVTFDDWEMSKSLVIPIIYDSTPDSNRTFAVSVAVSAEQAGEPDYILPPRVDPLYATSFVQILDYDVDPDSLSSTNGPSEPATTNGEPSMVNFERYTYRRPENGSATIRVYRIGGDNANTVRVAYNVDSGSANGSPNDNSFELEACSDYATPDPATTSPAGVDPDFTPVSGTLEWGPNDTQPKSITIPILSDTLPEFNEDIRIRLFTVGNGKAFLGNINEATLTILADPGDAPAGSLDPSYNPDYDISTEPPNNILPGANGIVYSTVLQADGKCLVAGNFANYNAAPRNRIARVNVNGSLDTTFNPGSGANDFITCMVLSSGKPVIGGGFTSFNGQFRSGIARLNEDGSVDSTFNPGLGANGTVWAIGVQIDGKIVIGGEFTTVNGYPRAHIARLNTDGSVDQTFNPTNTLNGWVEAIVLAPDGKIYVGGDFTMAGTYMRNSVARLNDDGSLDTTYDTRTGADGPVYAMVRKPDGKLIIAGSFDTVDQRTRHKIAGLNIDGTLDTSFNPGVGANDAIYALTLQPDGRILVGGSFTSYGNNRRLALARVFPDGTLDTSFMETAYNRNAGIPNLPYFTEGQYPQNSKNYLLALAIQNDGNVIIGGKFDKVGGGYFNSNIQTNIGTYEDEFDGYRLDIIRNRQNLARVFGGETVGAGNIGFAADSYAVDENAQYLFVKTVREHGTLGRLDATFSIAPQTPGAGVAEPTTDFTYNDVNPAFETSWGSTRSLSDGIFGTNNVSDMVTGGRIVANLDDIYITIPHRAGIQGARNAVMRFEVPSSTDVFFLGGANTPIGGALSARTTATLRINEVDTLPGTISFTSAEYAVNENATNAVITLTRTDGSSGTVAASFITTNGTATSGVNYTTQNRTVTFGEGVTNQTVTVPIIDNTTLQSDDLTVLLTLRNPVGGAALGVSNAVLSIIDNDFPAGRLNLSATNYTANEYAGTTRVTITRTGGNVGILDVQCRTAAGTAQSGVHFVGTTNVLHWDSGDATPRYMDVTLLPDALVTSNLSFNVRLSVPTTTGGVPIPLSQGARSNAVVTIVNQDYFGSPQFAAAPYHVDETAGYATINVIRVNGSAETISVNYATSDGSAVAGGPLPNYVATNGTLVFGPGIVNQTITVPILNDGVVNPSPHFFTVTLSGVTPAGAVLGDPEATQVLIKDAQSVNEPAGTLDPNFSVGIGFNGSVNSLALESNGSVLAGGAFTTLNGFPQNRLARILSNGSQDSTFMAGLDGANGEVWTVLSQTDLRVLVGGQFTTFNGVNRNYITRLNADGTLDTSFDPGSGADAPVQSLAEAFVNGERKLYLGGNFTTFNGVSSFGLVRLNENGTVDSTFHVGAGADGPVYAIAVYPTNTIQAGKVLIGGAFGLVNGVTRSGIARLNPDGTLDTSFNPGVGANGSVRALALQPDGKVLLGGNFTGVGGLPFNRVARLSLDGTVDTSFSVGEGMNDIVYAIALQSNNRIVVAGDFLEGSGVTRHRITRLMPDGTVDPTINFGSGANAFVSSIVVQPDDNLVIGGGFNSVQGQQQNRVARLFGGAMTGSGQIEFVSSLTVVLENGTNAVLKLRRIGGTSGPGAGGTGAVTVNVVSADITAVGGINYTPVNQTISFPMGEVEASFLVAVHPDSQITPDLYALLYLDAASELLGPQPVAFLQIVNVEGAIRFSSPNYVRNEDAIDGMATIQIVREGSIQIPASVQFATATGGTAVPGVNYLPVTNLVEFQSGEATKNVLVPVLYHPVSEGDRTVNMVLSRATNSVLLDPYQAVLTVQDVDLSPGQLTFSAPQYAALEGAGSAIITVLRTNGAKGIVQVNVGTVPGTALPGVRYVSTNLVLTFAEGQTSRSFPVTLINDSINQGSQSLSLVMSGPSGGATLTAPTNAELTILDDESDLTIGFTNGPITINDRGASPMPAGATPYPANVNVTGFGGVVSSMTVTLSNYTHFSPDDVGVLLVGPTGGKTLLMANAGGSSSLNNVILTFDDAATNSLPDATTFGSGSYKPTSYGALPPFPSPAPAGPYSNSLSVFNGTDPNGTWSLYVIDDSSPGAGTVQGGWSMSFRIAPTSTTEPFSLNAEYLSVTKAIRVSLTGQPFATYQLQSSANLKDWTNGESGVAAEDGVLTFSDVSAVTPDALFFRAKRQSP